MSDNNEQVYYVQLTQTVEHTYRVAANSRDAAVKKVFANEAEEVEFVFIRTDEVDTWLG